MKKLLPLITVLLLLSSCELIREFFGEEESEHPNMESICETLDKDGLISFILSVDPDILDVSEIDNIQYTFSYSNGGAENMNVDLNIDESYRRTDDTSYISRNSFSRDIIIYPNSAIELDNDNEPFEVAEIILDMPTDSDTTGKRNFIDRFGNLVTQISGIKNEKDCCTTIATSISNIIVTLKDKKSRQINLPGCYRILEGGECCNDLK